MTRLQKVRVLSYLKWVSPDFNETNLGSSKTTLCSAGFNHIVQGLRFYATEKSIPLEDDCQTKSNATEKCVPLENDCQTKSNGRSKTHPASLRTREAQAALREYLHSTRGLQLSVAETLSLNSPIFLGKLIKTAKKHKRKVGQDIARVLRSKPINEFEPFFESIGLRPSEFSTFLPPKLRFLNDDAMLLENYNVLCNYGVERESIGKIYKQAKEVFEYDYGILQSKLQQFEKIGLEQSAVVKFVSSSPTLLIGDKSGGLYRVIEKLQSIGIESGWIEGHILEGYHYWGHMLDLLSLLSEMGCSDKQVEKIVRQSPDLLTEESVNAGFSLMVFLLKFGSSMDGICSPFLQLPQVQVTKFLCNVRNCYDFLVSIKMEALQIGKIVCSHLLLLGSCSLKKPSSILATLQAGNERIRKLVEENPEILKEWVRGLKVEPLGNTRSVIMKTTFLLDLGFVENSNEMQKALKVFRGKEGELQERFDIFVKAGVDREDAQRMIKGTPQVLNQSSDVIKRKIDFILNELGYPLSTLVAFPNVLCHTIQLVKVRQAMYNWLKDHGRVKPNLSLSTFVSLSDKYFVKRYVNRHPGGPQAWEELKKLVEENPEISMERVLGSTVKPLGDRRPVITKTTFLMGLGFVEDSKEMQNALKVFRGKEGEELQERFDSFVKAGVDRDDLLQMIKKTPHVLNQSKDVIKRKIDLLLNVLGYPLSTLVSFPKILSYTIQRVKLRHAMYNWLKDHGCAQPNLSLSTIVPISDEYFIKKYVNRHPDAPQAWEELKKQIYGDE